MSSTLGSSPSTASAVAAPAYSTPAVPPQASPVAAAAAASYPPQHLRAVSPPVTASAYAIPPVTAAALPRVPSSPQTAPRLGVASSQASSFSPPSAVAATTSKTTSVAAAGASSEPLVLFEGDPQPAGLRNFPCALRNFKKAQVTTTCEIDCSDASCSKAKQACAQYVECHALVVKAPRSSSASASATSSSAAGRTIASASAVLKTDASRSKDDSLVRLQQSPWWGTPALQHGRAPRPRVYVVASYGGSGSKMLSG